MTLNEITDFLQNTSVIFASLFAIYGIDAWRREYVGKRQIELAEEVLTYFYQAKDAIEQIRSPFGYAGEGKSRKPQENEKPEHKDGLDQAYVLIERYKVYSELFSNIHSLRYRFMAQIGIDESDPFVDLNKIINELIAASHTMARLTTVPDYSLRTEEQEEKHYQRILKVQEIYYGSGGEDDEIARRVDKVIKSIESTCRAIIESKGTLYSFFNRKIFNLLSYFRNRVQ